MSECPAILSFSGGRSSGMMLHRALERGEEPHVVFCNTGREREETLEFVRDCEVHWRIPIVWLEYTYVSNKQGVRLVDFESASRRGEPFSAAIESRTFLPGPSNRFCTEELKIGSVARWARRSGIKRWVSLVGLRADEPARILRMERHNYDYGSKRNHTRAPLAEDGVVRADVMEFWSRQPFDLQLSPDESNCDCCFMKRLSVVADQIRRDPSSADWWIEQERSVSDRDNRSRYDRFREDWPKYEEIRRLVLAGEPVVSGRKRRLRMEGCGLGSGPADPCACSE